MVNKNVLQKHIIFIFYYNEYFFQDGPFVWEKTKQGHLLGAFFYGYLISQVPAAAVVVYTKHLCT